MKAKEECALQGDISGITVFSCNYFEWLPTLFCCKVSLLLATVSVYEYLYYYWGLSYLLAICMLRYLIFLALIFFKLVIYRRKKIRYPHIKKPYGSKKARLWFWMSCESIEIKKISPSLMSFCLEWAIGALI